MCIRDRAKIPLALPDFNGQIRLMAVAWDRDRVGRAEIAPLVRDPLVARVYLPRFLAPEDESRITVTAQNVNAPPGDYRIQLSATGAVAVGEASPFVLTVTQSTSQTSETRTFVLRGIAPGVGRVQLKVEGPNGFQLTRETEINVRPAQTITTAHSAQPVSYTHLDVYKRQRRYNGGNTDLR